jgi:hypothetical protein
MRMDCNGRRGALISVDGHFPPDLHDMLSDFPPMPERRVVKREELSDVSLADAVTEFKEARSQLLMSLHPKVDYVVELSHLQECVRLGFVVEKVNRVLSFDQKPFLKPFIEKCVALRQSAETDKAFDSDSMYKLMMNSLAGRMQLNVRAHDDVRILKSVTSDDFSSSHFRGFHSVFGDPNLRSDNGLHMLTMRRPSVTLNAPIAVGVCILEKAKAHNLRLWYGGLRNAWSDCRLLYHDTDSFFIEVPVKPSGLWSNIRKLKTVECVDAKRTKTPGLLKIEAERIAEFICYGKKMYSALLFEGSQKAATAGLSIPPAHQLFRERLVKSGQTCIVPGISRIACDENTGDVAVLKKEETRSFAANVEASRYWMWNFETSLALGHHATIKECY